MDYIQHVVEREAKKVHDRRAEATDRHLRVQLHDIQAKTGWSMQEICQRCHIVIFQEDQETPPFSVVEPQYGLNPLKLNHIPDPPPPNLEIRPEYRHLIPGVPS